MNRIPNYKLEEHLPTLEDLCCSRRSFLQRSGMGMGALSLASILGTDFFGATKAEAAGSHSPLAARAPHFPAKAKQVIFLHMTGSPPHLDLFDFKPELVKRTDQPCPDEFYEGKQFAFTSSRPTLLGTPHKFAQHGGNGA